MADKPFKPHPIQLVRMGVVELWIESKAFGSSENLSVGDRGFAMTTSRSPFDDERKTIDIRLKVEIGNDFKDDSDKELPFDLRVEIVGTFTVDVESFNMKYLKDWAKQNAPLVLYPHVREHVYSLVTRCGFTGVILPLFEFPTIRIKPE